MANFDDPITSNERLRVMRTNCEESQPDHELPLRDFLRNLALRLEHVRGPYIKQEDADRLRAHAFAMEEVMR